MSSDEESIPGGSYLSECHSHNWKFQKNIIGHYLLNSSDIKENRSEAEATAKRQRSDSEATANQ
jgi:hypothetical protein